MIHTGHSLGRKREGIQGGHGVMRELAGKEANERAVRMAIGAPIREQNG